MMVWSGLQAGVFVGASVFVGAAVGVEVSVAVGEGVGVGAWGNSVEQPENMAARRQRTIKGMDRKRFMIPPC